MPGNGPNLLADCEELTWGTFVPLDLVWALDAQHGQRHGRGAGPSEHSAASNMILAAAMSPSPQRA
eukprot:12896351-Alexandrium_andersonii.AAC.1